MKVFFTYLKLTVVILQASVKLGWHREIQVRQGAQVALVEQTL